MRKTVRILDANIDVLTMKDAVNRVFDFVSEDGNHMIFTPNSEIIYASKYDKELNKILNQSDMNIADGAGVVLGAKILGLPLVEKVSGIDLIKYVITDERAKGLRIFLFGSAPGVAELAGKKLMEFNDDITISGTRDGSLYLNPDVSPEDESAIIKAINDSDSDLLLVALGAPRQEKWIYRYRDELNVKVCIGVGGSLDVYSGRTEPTPEFLRRNGFEWLHRLYKEPKRIVRMLALPKYVLLLIKMRILK
jgi:N-acetylglucosaminyldiphosphoundecaprenol N-acetyl-beta-D-mannosaminyltransferase